MAEIILDLSGRAGLGPNFSGDPDMLTPQPNLRMSTKEGRFAQGLFNPYLRNGYLSPVTNTKTALTAGSAIVDRLTSVVYHPDNGKLFTADYTGQIFSQDSLTDSSLTLITDLWSASDDSDVTDLEMYMVDDEVKLFAVGTRTIFTNDTEDFEAVSKVIPGSTFNRGAGFMIPGIGGVTPPTRVVYGQDFKAASGSLLDVSVTVPAGSNQLFVAAFASPNNPGSTDVLFNGDFFTPAGSGSGSGYGRVFYLKNPDQGTFTLRFSTSTIVDRIGHWAVYNDVDLTSFDSANCDISAGGSAGGIVLVPTSAESANTYIEFIDTNSTYIIQESGQEELDLDTESGATDYLVLTSTLDLTSKILDAAVFSESGSLEVSSIIKPQHAGNANTVPYGGFYQKVSSDWAFMRKADNGFMYVFAENRVHKFDGTITGGESGTFTKDILLFPSNFRMVDAIDYNSKMYICIHQYPVLADTTTSNLFNGKTGIVMWNKQSTQFNATDFIEFPGVREIKKIFVSPDEVIKLIVINDYGLVELRRFGYNDSGSVVFPPVHTLGVGAFPQFPDGVTIAGDKTLWLANDGRVYCDKLNNISTIFEFKAPGATLATTQTNIGSGILFFGNGTETASSGFRANKQKFIASFKDTTPYVYSIYPFDLTTGTDSAQTPHQGDVFTEVQLMPVTAVTRNVRVYNAPITGSGTDVIATVKLYFNQSASVGMTKTITKDEAKRGYVDFKINKPYVHAVQIEIEWATGTPLGADMYLPSTAIITYDETTTSSPDNG